MTKFILKIKEQETRLTLHEHDDDDDDDDDDLHVSMNINTSLKVHYTERYPAKFLQFIMYHSTSSERA